MKKYEYIMWYVEGFKETGLAIIVYEVDLENERYATRMAEIYEDGRICPIIEEGWEFITEEPVPTIEEINSEDGWCAKIISKDSFEEIYNGTHYSGEVTFDLPSFIELMSDYEGFLVRLRCEDRFDEALYAAIKSALINESKTWKEQGYVPVNEVCLLSELIDQLSGGSRFFDEQTAIKVEDAGIEILDILHSMLSD